LLSQAIKLRVLHGAVPQCIIAGTFFADGFGVPIFTSLGAEACGSLNGWSLKQFFAVSIISIGIGALHDLP
jgi:hypothetical protein